MIKNEGEFFVFCNYALFKKFYKSILKHKDKLKFELYPLSIRGKQQNVK